MVRLCCLVNDSMFDCTTDSNTCAFTQMQYQFDGTDFDWEYPADTGRGGVPADKQNYALLVEAVRNAFNAEPEDFEIAMAIPISTSKLDVGYNLVSES
jgi:GH18 family chitinase